MSAQIPTSRKEREKWGTRRTGGESGGLALEQLPILRIRRSGIGSDQRLDLVGGENSTVRWLRFKNASKSDLGAWVPHFSRSLREVGPLTYSSR
jgi:hypothetical protein